MDDGTICSSGLRLCLHAFSYTDFQIFSHFLESQYSLKNTLQAANSERTQWYIYIRAESMPLLIPLVKPYMVTSMHYKLGKHIN
jgi:hypothetical protein